MLIGICSALCLTAIANWGSFLSVLVLMISKRCMLALLLFLLLLWRITKENRHTTMESVCFIIDI